MAWHRAPAVLTVSGWATGEFARDVLAWASLRGSQLVALDALARTLVGHPRSTVVVPMDNAPGRPAALGDRIRSYPTAGLIVIVDQADSGLDALAQLARSTGCRLLSHRSPRAELELQSLLDQQADAEYVRQVMASAPEPVATDLRPLVRVVLRCALRSGGVRDLARLAGMPERSLRHCCLTRRLPSPRWLLMWARCMLAAHAMEAAGTTWPLVAGRPGRRPVPHLVSHVAKLCDTAGVSRLAEFRVSSLWALLHARRSRRLDDRYPE